MIERTTHMAFAIGLFEKMSDADLVQCFKNAAVHEIRVQLAEWRTEGFEFVPCACGNYDADGKCNGGIHKSSREVSVTTNEAQQ